MPNKTKDFIKCDFCKNKAIYNLQEQWWLYRIDKKEKDKEIGNSAGNENNYYCKDCAIECLSIDSDII